MPIPVPEGRRLYRFVVIADTHVNQSDDGASSFFPLNRLANARAAAAFKAASKLKPAFVVHLGDIVHPLPCSPAFESAAQRYRELERTFDCPVHLTPGNHDIGDKRWPLAPVAGIEPDFIRDYERVFGEQWHAWTHGPCRYIVLNTSLMNSGLPEEQVQRDWFERELTANPTDRRIFIALHYPPYLRNAQEPPHYDNIDEPARGWLLGLLALHQVEAVFCGHVHNFWYDQHGDTELYLLPSTAFVRQDYSELQRITPPGDEGGRQDSEKLGFFLVDVYERGHIARFMRCAMTDDAPEASMHAESPHPKRPVLPNLGIDMAYPWAEEVELPPNPALDEFRHKRVRNDYPLLALFELGISCVRVPIEDLDEESLFSRLRKLGNTGFRAQVVISADFPSPTQEARLRELGPALQAVEWVLHEDAMPSLASRVHRVMRELGRTTLLISKLRRPRDAEVDGLRYGHLVFHGWVMQETDAMRRCLRDTFADCPGGGLVVRVRLNESPLQAAREAQELARALKAPITLMVRLATDDPATAQLDPVVLNRRVVEVALAAWRYPGICPVIDGLVDVDRGYFLRLGLIDRAYNQRPAAYALRHLQAWLARRHRASADIDCSVDGDGASYFVTSTDGALRIRVRGDAIEATDDQTSSRWQSLCAGGTTSSTAR